MAQSRNPPASRVSNRAFRAVIVATAVFFVLTLTAMALYPGGRVGDADAPGYSFFANFFSDLGQTQTHSGAANTVSLALFCSAMAVTAFALIVFFLGFAKLFAAGTTGAKFAAAAASCAIVTAVCFIGVAATPWNLYLRAHNVFVMWAFRAFLAAVLLDTAAVLTTPAFPRRFAAVFGAFALLLAAYVALLALGPPPSTAAGALIQATGQKIIVFASVLTILVQALSVQAFARSNRQAS